MMGTVGATLAAGYFLLVAMSGRWALVLAVVPLPAPQAGVYSAALIQPCRPLCRPGLGPRRILDRLRRNCKPARDGPR
jgi:hypothetical protein